MSRKDKGKYAHLNLDIPIFIYNLLDEEVRKKNFEAINTGDRNSGVLTRKRYTKIEIVLRALEMYYGLQPGQTNYETLGEAKNDDSPFADNDPT